MKLYPSHISLYLQCPLRFKFKILDRRREPVTPALYLGARVHDALDAFFDLPASKRSLPALETLFRNQWSGKDLPSRQRRRRIRERTEAFGDERDMEGEYGRRGLAMLERFYNLPRLQITPLETEIFLEQELIPRGASRPDWEYNEELVLAGKLDRVDQGKGDTIQVTDYKTNRYPPSGPDDPRLYSDVELALKIYTFLAEHHFGKRVSRVSLVYLANGSTFDFEFESQELEAVRQRVIELASRIKEDQQHEPQLNNFCPCGFVDDCPLVFDEVPF